MFRAREIGRLEPQDRWDTTAINSIIGVPWRMTDGKWTVNRPEVRVDPIPIPPRVEAQNTVHLKTHGFHAVCFPHEVAVVRQTPSGQLTTIMLTSAHPCLHAVARAMCGSSFLALRCFPPAPFPSVSTCGGLHLWVVPERRSASGEIRPPADGNIEVRQQDVVVVL